MKKTPSGNHVPCSRQLLASSEIARVERCQCGHAHITVGPLTVRVDQRAIPELAAIFEQASQSLGAALTAERVH